MRDAKHIRMYLGLTQSQMAKMLDTDLRTYQRYEAKERPAPSRMDRLMDAYVGGYRPDDWPKEQP